MSPKYRMIIPFRGKTSWRTSKYRNGSSEQAGFRDERITQFSGDSSIFTYWCFKK